jgi:hypothetical protein
MDLKTAIRSRARNRLETLRAEKRRLREDFPYYAAQCLKIRPKSGGLVPLSLNQVQSRIHEALERQLLETGRVRALILKARQRKPDPRSLRQSAASRNYEQGQP